MMVIDEETLRKRATKLAKHKYLETLYKTLVLKNVLSASEFWDEYGKDIDRKKCSLGLIEGMTNSVLSNTMQRETWSLFSVFKDDINNAQQNNEENEEKENHKTKTINLQREQILEIFINLPEVKLCFEKTVPHKFTEKEFWTAFLQSHYFKRETSKNVSSGISDKETPIDGLLKKYIKLIKQQKNEQKIMDNDDGINGFKSNLNTQSFANQLAKIQSAKNKEVDVEGALNRMKKEVAEARAAKNGTNGDMQQLVAEINGGNITGNDDGANIEKNGSRDVEMKDAEQQNEENKPLKRRRNFKKKLQTLDPSIDLTTTMESFTEILEDPGNEEMKDMNRDDVQSWFNQVNKHGMMLLYQSLNQKGGNKKRKRKEDIAEIMHNVPKVQYGKKYKNLQDLNDGDDADEDGDEKMNGNGNVNDERKDNLEVMEMEYEDRLNKETEFEDLREESDAKYIELKIKDQSVYWGDNLLLNDKELGHMNQVAKQLHDYLKKVDAQKPKLAEITQTHRVIPSRQVDITIKSNTENNSATSKAKLASDRILENKRRNGKKGPDNKEKPMKELVRHYWSCFPANHQRLKKSQIIVENLSHYKKTLKDFQHKLDKRGKLQQKILLQELIDLADKVLEHNGETQKKLQQKKQRSVQPKKTD